MSETPKNIAGTTVAFGEVVQLSKERSKDPEADGFERFLGLEHLEPGDLQVRSWGDLAEGTTFTNVFRQGQVLFGKRRAYQRKVAVADFSGVCSGDIYVFEPKGDRLLPELLPFVCQSQPFYDYVISMSQGGLSPRVNWKALSKYEFALPPLDEQRRIALALVSVVAAKNGVADAIARGESLFSRLAMDLTLPRGAALRADKTLARVPGGWTIRRIGELCSEKTDLVIGPFGSNLKREDYEGQVSGVPVVFVRDVRPNRFEYSSNCFVTEAKAAELAAHVAMPGDLLVTKVGVPESKGIPPGLAAVLPEDFPDAIVTADVVRARVNPEVALPEYLAYALNTAWGRQQTWRISPGSTTRFKMTLGKFSDIRLPIPSLERQGEIVSVLNRLRVSVAALRERRSGFNRLIESILRERLAQ